MKVRLTLLPGCASAEDIAKLFEKLTRRKPTKQEMEEVRRILAKFGDIPTATRKLMYFEPALRLVETIVNQRPNNVVPLHGAR